MSTYRKGQTVKGLGSYGSGRTTRPTGTITATLTDTNGAEWVRVRWVDCAEWVRVPTGDPLARTGARMIVPVR